MFRKLFNVLTGALRLRGSAVGGEGGFTPKLETRVSPTTPLAPANKIETPVSDFGLPQG
ncbi:hypothetical protein Q8F55_007616 [Vanrija albida]|uniref:Uncharacterized protein n=1 Tax=Vanrija albida TaxID=181172 RepID=A0ABR3PU24_9TREE